MTTTTEAFAMTCESQANWRELKAKEYPGDKRNLASAAALYEAAEWARTCKDAADRLGGTFENAATGFLMLGEEAHRVLSRYGFHARESLRGLAR